MGAGRRQGKGREGGGGGGWDFRPPTQVAGWGCRRGCHRRGSDERRVSGAVQAKLHWRGVLEGVRRKRGGVARSAIGPCADFLKVWRVRFGRPSQSTFPVTFRRPRTAPPPSASLAACQTPAGSADVGTICSSARLVLTPVGLTPPSLSCIRDAAMEWSVRCPLPGLHL